MSRACGNCQWWVESADRDLKGLGRCKGGPPTTGKGGLGDWPVTGAAEWCGAFRMAEEVARNPNPELYSTPPGITASPASAPVFRTVHFDPLAPTRAEFEDAHRRMGDRLAGLGRKPGGEH